MKVYVNPPKTPVTKGSKGIAAATIPNICKMPGPPAPFVPVPLPNIGKSGDSPKDYSKKVKFEGKEVAIKGATFKSKGDAASKGTGGGLISANTHGPTKFVGPGSLDVNVEGKAVQLLSDPMLNNCGPSGSPPNSATLSGVIQGTRMAAVLGDEPCPMCGETHELESKLKESVDTQGDCDEFKSAADAAYEEAKVEQNKALAAAQKKHAEGIARQKKRLLMKSLGKKANNPKAVRDIRDAENREITYDTISVRKPEFEAMMGVVKCNKGQTYVAFSSKQYEDIQRKLPRGWHNPIAYESLAGQRSSERSSLGKERFLPYVGDQTKFTKRWNQIVKYFDDSKGSDFRDTFKFPGVCAAQQAMILAMDHECRPVGLTERWYDPTDPNAPYKGTVHVRDKPGSPKRRSRKGEFGGKKAVPPCDTCEFILESLMCPKERPSECSCKAPTGEGVCICSP